ncbi:sulfite exporter TauE/SafE family protein [Knoellia aerolata]|uniref:Probable membrane transporter protein n=1 Tax=Knoellia aerolata DSM 18566 TaxID=1385519 RepID=A0A0A0JWK4_9MICO|nr:sulfite exporter TauE/SafE family protein [Knoellia aerolata]KGN41573.1 membrane protein [Knoellia aerolata DSM 18566]
MSLLEGAVLFLAGLAGGTINAVVGSGSLITFPTLVALGYPPVLANVSNNIGMVPGGLAGTWGCRKDLVNQRGRLAALAAMSALGGLSGALLLLVLPPETFRTVVPILLGLSVGLVVMQPAIQRSVALRRSRAVQGARPSTPLGARVGVALAGTYGGYFGGAQGVLLIGVLGGLLPESLHRINALKNALATCVNACAAVVFLAVAREQVDWRLVVLIAAGSACGGLIGARVGRALSQRMLRAVVVVVGLSAIAVFVRS